ncbi:helix-turn-helix domain-containing protein [Helcococcus kunzii]|uniref:helix-turn-helix domain-containing protein n=1 Tax=Helcococcus kunzii TaxID=40091 RepID=UPI0038A2BA62
MKLINKIKDILDKKDMSIYRLQQLTDLSYATVYNLVNSDNFDRVNFDTVYRIAKALNVEITELYEESEEMKEMIYLRIAETETDGWIEDYDTLEEANTKADEYWYYLTKYEKERTRVYVLGLEKQDYDKVQNDETEKWYGDFADDSLDTFDSDDLK